MRRIAVVFDLCLLRLPWPWGCLWPWDQSRGPGRTVRASRSLSLTHLAVIAVQIDRSRAPFGVLERVVFLRGPIAERKIVGDDARARLHLGGQQRTQLQIRRRQ